VNRGLTLRFDEFGWESLELEALRESTSDGEDVSGHALQRLTLDDLLSRAAAYFDAERPTRRAATLAPGFKPGGQGTPREIQLEVDRDCWERLESEAARQGVALERVLEHAALLYLADIDSGRVAHRGLGRAGDDGDEP
jgi:hypothetical protein